MKEEDKNRKPELSDFIKYRKREMTDLQRNAFERKLQKDPFSEEAEEGFSVISPDEAVKDLLLLNKQLKSRVAHRRMVYYRIAASIAVLMIISSVYILTERNRSKEKTAEIALNQKFLEIPASKAIILPEVPPSSENIQFPGRTEDKKKEISDTKVQSFALPQADEMMAPQAIAEEKNARAEINKNDVSTLTDSVNREPVEFMAAADSEAQDKLDLVSQEINELAVVGYGAAKRSRAAAGVAAAENKAENPDAGYTQPAPVDGKESFDKYVENNIRKPASLLSGEKVVVIISFVIKSSGVIENIKVIRSQGQEYTDEAIRLIKEGPAWKPAEENGQKIDDEVRMRIVFK